jgi:hypothetical protein
VFCGIGPVLARPPGWFRNLLTRWRSAGKFQSVPATARRIGRATSSRCRTARGKCAECFTQLAKTARIAARDPRPPARFPAKHAEPGGVGGHSGGFRADLGSRWRTKSSRLLLHSRAAFGIALLAVGVTAASSFGRGCSSVVEHDLAKVGVEGSSPFARSKCFSDLAEFDEGPLTSGLFVLGVRPYRSRDPADVEPSIAAPI